MERLLLKKREFKHADRDDTQKAQREHMQPHNAEAQLPLTCARMDLYSCLIRFASCTSAVYLSRV